MDYVTLSPVPRDLTTSFFFSHFIFIIGLILLFSRKRWVLAFNFWGLRSLEDRALAHLSKFNC